MRTQVSTLGFGELFDMAFRLMCLRFGLLLRIQICFALPLFVPLLLLGLSSTTTDLNSGGAGVDLTFFLFLGGLVAVLIIPAAAVTQVVAALYRGERTSFVRAVGAGLRVLLPLVGTSLLYMLLFGLVGFVAMLIGVVLPKLFTFVIMLGLVVLMIYFGLPLILLTPIAVLERTYLFAAFSRCYALMEGYRIRALAMLIVEWIVMITLQFSLHFVAELSYSIAFAVALLWHAITASYGFALNTVLYFDLRCRNEGYDLEEMTAEVARRTAA